MPYIKQEERPDYDSILQELSKALVNKPKGHLNYVVSVLCWGWVTSHGVGYTTISEGLGALIDAAEELRRRKLNPYEDEKIEENGDVY